MNQGDREYFLRASIESGNEQAIYEFAVGMVKLELAAVKNENDELRDEIEELTEINKVLSGKVEA